MKQYFVVLLALLVACAPQMVEKPMEKAPVMEKEPVMEKAPVMEEKEEIMEKPVMEEKKMMEPGLIGGGTSRYYNWDEAKFYQAVQDKKTVYLEFSADWCGVCQNQEPHLIAGFAELNDPNVVGFKIHYKDGQTTDEHKALVQQYQIAYQHTKVVLKDGKQVLKSPEAWTKDKFLEEMRKLG